MSQIHQPLPSLTSIRLLHLFPGSEGEPIRCELKTYEADNAPSYEALSYCWGSPEPAELIAVNEQLYPVGPNLFAALQNLRRERFVTRERAQLAEIKAELEWKEITATPADRERASKSDNPKAGTSTSEPNPVPPTHSDDMPNEHERGRSFGRIRNPWPYTLEGEERVLWIDAISLNQSDNTEKGTQVRRMFTIYARAQRVISWLGQEDGARKGLAVVAVAMQEDQLTYTESFGDPPREYSKLEPDAWIYLAKIFRREYFQRVWIIQEVAAAATVVMMLGDLEIDWDLFAPTIARIWILLSLVELKDKSAANVLSGFLTIYKHARRVVQDREKATEMSHIFRWRLLWHLDAFKSSLSIDKICAILGLLEGIDIEPDYTAPPVQFFNTFMGQLIEASSSLSWLGAVTHPIELPAESTSTWVRDWSQETAQSITFNKEPGLNLMDPAFSNWIPPHTKDPRREILQVQGTIALTATACSTVLIDGEADTTTVLEDLPNSYSVWVRDFFQRVTQISAKIYCYPEETLKTILRNILIHPGSTKYKHDVDTSLGDRYPTQSSGIHISQLASLSMINEAWEGKDEQYRAWGVAVGRRMFVAKHESSDMSYLGYGPWTMKAGDRVVFLRGGPTPFILRAALDGSDTSANNRFQFIGECYVHGLMRGEVSRSWKDGSVTLQDMELV